MNFVFMIDGSRSGIYPVTNRRTGAIAKQPSQMFPKEIVEWFDRVFRNALQEANEARQERGSTTVTKLTVQLVTQIKLGDPAGTGSPDIVRAHPNFNGVGCWYEYVEIDYGEAGLFPARCAAFFRWPEGLKPSKKNKDDLGGVGSGDLMALVQQSNYQTKTQEKGNSLLFSNWNMQQNPTRHTAKFRAINAGTINRRIFAFDLTPSDGGPFHKLESRVFEIVKVEDRQLEWPTRFLTSYKGWKWKTHGLGSS